MKDECKQIVLSNNRVCQLCNKFIYCGETGIKVVEEDTRKWYHIDCWRKKCEEK